jgi:Fe2+ transport system protein FeoA
MTESSLKKMPLGASGRISRCLAPLREDVYRLLEMGLCEGAYFTVLQSSNTLGALELSLPGSRLCIGDDLANQFLAVAFKPKKS